MLVGGEIQQVAEMPPAERVEIVSDGAPDQPAMMYRFTSEGEFCGDTWHETVERAFDQAEHEFGLAKTDFEMVPDEVETPRRHNE
jgi:hypothetical protein